MRLYGKRFMTNRTEMRIQNRKESRDAVVYDIDEDHKYCRVLVAGSDVKVRAWFPANFMRAPQWLKVGTAVRISHVGGDKSRIEVVSSGLIQPSQATTPMQGGVDTILIGMEPSAPLDGDGWTVSISTGTYRINGVTYRFTADGPDMNDPNWHMGDGGEMSGDYWWGSVDPMGDHDPDELWFRYDAFVIGNDGVVDYIKGEEWMWEVGGAGPTKPDVPLNHVLIRENILLWSGTESITQDNVGKEWEAPHPESLVTNYTYSEPLHEPAEGGYAREREGIGVIKGGPSTYVPVDPDYPERLRGAEEQDMQADVNVTVMDQYGRPYSWWSSGSVNQLGIRKVGSASYGHYGTVGTGLGGPGPVPDLVGEESEGEEVFVSLGLGSTYGFSYVREHETIAQPDGDAPGYPSYERGTDDSHTSILKVRLVSPDAQHDVSTIVNFWVLDSSGHPQ